MEKGHINTDYITVSLDDFNDINFLPVSYYGQTLEEIAHTDPVQALRHLHRIIYDNPSLDIEFTVSSGTGTITTEEDGEAARLAFLKQNAEIFCGSTVSERRSLIINGYSKTSNKLMAMASWITMMSGNEELLTINVEPPVY